MTNNTELSDERLDAICIEAGLWDKLIFDWLKPIGPDAVEVMRNLRIFARRVIAADRAIAPSGEQLLAKPAQVGGGTFQAGVPERHVIGAAQRHYEAQAEERAKTPEQRAADERNRRAMWDVIHGEAGEQHALEPVAWRANVREGTALPPHWVFTDFRAALNDKLFTLEPLYTSPPRLAGEQEPVAQVSRDDLMQLAEDAGIAPNTIRHWETAFVRFGNLLTAKLATHPNKGAPPLDLTLVGWRCEWDTEVQTHYIADGDENPRTQKWDDEPPDIIIDLYAAPSAPPSSESP